MIIEGCTVANGLSRTQQDGDNARFPSVFPMARDARFDLVVSLRPEQADGRMAYEQAVARAYVTSDQPPEGFEGSAPGPLGGAKDRHPIDRYTTDSRSYGARYGFFTGTIRHHGDELG